MIKLSTEDLQLEIVADGELGLNQKQSAMTGINMMPDIYAFCLPGLVEELTNSTSFLAHVSIKLHLTRYFHIAHIVTYNAIDRQCISTRKSTEHIPL
jgi:hypothetical protein